MKTSDRTKISQVKVKTYDNEDVVLTLKKEKNQNEYLKVENFWVRNFVTPSIKDVDLNNLYYDIDLNEIILNEMNNTRLKNATLESAIFSKYRNFVIVSDGYGFDDHVKFDNLRSDVCLILVNQAARLWSCRRMPDFLIVNNPTKTCMTNMPVRFFPQLIASRKTYHDFVRAYPNTLYFYDAVPDSYYQTIMNGSSELHIDDYRNSICAAIGLIYKLGFGNVFMAFCSHAYKEKRAAMEQVDDGLYNYPQQQVADKLIDGNLFFYKFGRQTTNIFHVGYKKSYKFSKYLHIDDMVELLK